MSGASLPASINSPVLRRAGGKPALLEQGLAETSEGEGLPLSVEMMDLKSGNVLIHGAAITPSPVLLWRLKVLLFLVWGISCCKISWDSVMRMSADLQDLFLYEAFLYYNPLLLVTFTVFLWGVNLWVFGQSSVSYSKVFDLNNNYLTHREILKCATWMAIVVPTSMTAYLYLYSHGEVSLAASQPVMCIFDFPIDNMGDNLTISCSSLHKDVVILYAIFVMVLIFPFDIFYLSSRFYFLRTLWRIILPLQAISFADFFLADILTSMSKAGALGSGAIHLSDGKPSAVLGDAYMVFMINDLVLRMRLVFYLNHFGSVQLWPFLWVGRGMPFNGMHDLFLWWLLYLVWGWGEWPCCSLEDGPPYDSCLGLEMDEMNGKVATIAWFEADSICGSHSIAIPLVLVFPYLCRFFQCLRQFRDTKERSSLLNALKYSTAIPVVFLSALKYHVLPANWTNFYRPLWLLSCTLNSLYSFYWDITRDWDLSTFSSVFKFKNPNLFTSLLYGRMWVYYWVLSSNLVLRCTWTYKLSAHLRHNYLTVFTVTALEIFRRFQWIFFRVENEWNKMTSKTNSELKMEEMLNEEARLLGSSNHNV
ncbi:hypothetical protein IEQ34_009768 [Dendrobium chrysotoxum]|uniref:EXS domain-containing protein n=1 Tax=Dendrobium chrysotoxum TaxID=161865 RepID=A0AAV7H2G9_DENCH|nr:hypothetical protein IEQ34_009768 [Dendrobium chrysotoxum]